MIDTPMPPTWKCALSKPDYGQKVEEKKVAGDCKIIDWTHS